MSKLVSVERRSNEFIVTSYTQSKIGFWQMNGWFRRIPIDSERVSLGQAVLDALEASNQTPLPDGDPLKAKPFAPVLAALGLRTFAQYMKGTRSIRVEIRQDQLLHVTPRRNDGPRDGFVPLEEKAHVLHAWNAEAVGAAAEAGMELAED